MRVIRPYFKKAGIPDVKVNFGRTTGAHVWKVEMPSGREDGKWAPADTIAKFHEHKSPLSLMHVLRPALPVSERVRLDLSEGKPHPSSPVVFC